MRKKKIISLIFLLLLAAALVVCFLPSSEPKVIGVVSPNDLAEIKRVIHREIWRGIFPNWSWKTLKRLPGNFIVRFPQHILRIEAGPDRFVHALMSTGKTKQTEALQPAYYDIYMQKEAKGWKVFRPVANLDPVPGGRSF